MKRNKSVMYNLVLTKNHLYFNIIIVGVLKFVIYAILNNLFDCIKKLNQYNVYTKLSDIFYYSNLVEQNNSSKYN